MQEVETQNNVIRIRVSDLLFALQKRWMVIVALSMVGLTFGLILSAMTVVQSSYQTFAVTGSFAVTSKNSYGKYVGGYDAPNINDFHLAEDMVDAVRYVLRSEQVLDEVLNENEVLGYSVDQLRSAITVSQYNTTQILEMKIIWRNAEEGIMLWNAIIGKASSLLPETLQLGSLAVINQARANPIGVVGSGSNKVVLLTLLGFSAGIGYALIELLMHPTLNNVRDVETLFSLETIGIIPHDREFAKRKDSIMTHEDMGSSSAIQNFSAAAYILRNRLGTKDSHHCFYITSATLGEGKSTVAANLAIQLSDMEHRVLLIDFDTRNPRLGSLFLKKVDYAHSLNALYRGDATQEEAVITLSGYLDLLPAVLEHNAISVDSMLIELVEKLNRNYEYVILDAPPVGMVSGTLSLNQIASSALFVIGYDSSTLPEIQSALDKLYKSGTRVLGCIVNNVVSGRSLGITQTADDYKNSIGKKAREKKREEEKYGFDDDAAGSAGAGPDPARTGSPVIENRSSAAAEKPAVNPVPAPQRRNVFEDAMSPPPKKAASLDDQAILQGLVEIGLQGSWDTPSEKDGPAAPAENEPVPPVPLREEPEDVRSLSDAAGAAPAPKEPEPRDGGSLSSEPAPGEAESGRIPPVPVPSGPWPGEDAAESSVQPPSGEDSGWIPAARTGFSYSRPAGTDTAAEGAPSVQSPAEAGTVPPDMAETGAADEKPVQRRAKATLPLFILLAIPAALAGSLLLLLVSAGILAAAAALGAFCATSFLSAGSMPLMEEKLVALGASLAALGLVLALLWLLFLVPVRGFPALFRFLSACCRKWCYREVVQ